ncbi:SLAP domain-containing protein [Lactobacillus amylovorus]|uniref:SLAP domain-containing protein n=1 Tax=Lactobacillus amylovorus TaxID=1604 RepID=UPI00232EB2EB|nr:SLAP domain-containing protein [Lactobacillus amylovorus]MDB6238282.1 SLAP domain-containing protein [Lactobacillus amylovorus]
MKKMKVIGVAAAALLAVSPLLASSTVGAAINYNGTSYNSNETVNVGNASFARVPLNGNVDVDAIERAFATPNSSVSVNLSYIETRIAGTYPVPVTVTNNSNNSSTTVTINVTVGDSNSVQSIQGDTDSNAGVYRINGKEAEETGITLPVGTPVSTYGTIDVDGTSYTRLNSANSHLAVKTGWFTGAYKGDDDATKATVFTMHKALMYDKNGNKTGKAFRQFRNIDVYSNKVTIKGVQYYRVYNTFYYVKAANIDGTKRMLKKNSYIHQTGSKRANKKVLKKGSTVTTYGSSFKFANGKRYYRVGKGKQYVPVANFE